MKTPLPKRFETAKSDHRVSPDKLVLILRKLYPLDSTVEVKEGNFTPRQMTLATFIESILERKRVNDSFQGLLGDPKYEVLDSELLRYTQVNGVGITASLWKQPRIATLTAIVADINNAREGGE